MYMYIDRHNRQLTPCDVTALTDLALPGSCDITTLNELALSRSCDVTAFTDLALPGSCLFQLLL